ncbi:MAG: RNA 2',3'-cyclic phosphodiesterase [Rhodocyclaceae bacterium]
MSAERLRVFFALWPDAATAERLEALAGQVHAQCGGRRMRRDTLHMTLCFIGEIGLGSLAALEAAVATVKAPAFRIDIDRAGWWPHKQIVWAGCGAGARDVAALAEMLRAAVSAQGFKIEKRPFQPHVTLLRKGRCPPVTDRIEAVSWPVHEWVLVASERDHAGSRYRRLGCWPLGAEAK